MKNTSYELGFKDGSIAGYKLAQGDLEKLRTAEQERDQYKAKFEEQKQTWDYYQDLVRAHGCSSITDLLAAFNADKRELESLCAKIKESQEEIERMQRELHKSNMYNKDLHTEICGLRAKIKESQEQKPVAFCRLVDLDKEDFVAITDANDLHKIKLYKSPVIPD